MEKKPQQSESRDADKYIVRFPDGMRDEIAASAKANNRSMNAEIIARLEKSFNPISDEGDVMRAVRAIGEYSSKFNVDVSVNFSKSPQGILADAIKSGTLPADATLADIGNPAEASGRLEVQNQTEHAHGNRAKPIRHTRTGPAPK